MSAVPFTVLVVDDEEPVRALVRRYLETRTWTVLDAPGGHEALELLNKHPRIDLLITDINMPEMSGIELAALMHARFGGLKVLYLTGYVEKLFEGRDWLRTGETFLEKPFTSRGMRDALEGLLGRRK